MLVWSVIRTQSKQKSQLMMCLFTEQSDTLSTPNRGLSLKNFCFSEIYPKVLSSAECKVLFPSYTSLPKDLILEKFSLMHSYCCWVAQLCLILCDPMDYSPRGSSVHGILQAGILEWVAIPLSRDSSQPRDQIQVSCTGRQILYHWATWEALILDIFAWVPPNLLLFSSFYSE